MITCKICGATGEALMVMEHDYMKCILNDLEITQEEADVVFDELEKRVPKYTIFDLKCKNSYNDYFYIINSSGYRLNVTRDVKQIVNKLKQESSFIKAMYSTYYRSEFPEIRYLHILREIKKINKRLDNIEKKIKD